MCVYIYTYIYIYIYIKDLSYFILLESQSSQVLTSLDPGPTTPEYIWCVFSFGANSHLLEPSASLSLSLSSSLKPYFSLPFVLNPQINRLGFHKVSDYPTQRTLWSIFLNGRASRQASKNRKVRTLLSLSRLYLCLCLSSCKRFEVHDLVCGVFFWCYATVTLYLVWTLYNFRFFFFFFFLILKFYLLIFN